jgi:hypothetical protein
LNNEHEHRSSDCWDRLEKEKTNIVDITARKITTKAIEESGEIGFFQQKVKEQDDGQSSRW